MNDDGQRAGPAKGIAELTLTYTEIGATRGKLPGGYRHVRHAGRLGCGREIFEAATEFVLSWSMHRAAGLKVQATRERAAPGTDALLRIGSGPFRLLAPVRVVYELSEPARTGFAYGTLDGHPESGEEAFVNTIDHDDSVSFAVIGFSKPVSAIARLGGPVSRLAQDRVINRYVKAVQLAVAK